MRFVVMILWAIFLMHCLYAQPSQNPSPMVEHTRTHPRLKESRPPGPRKKLQIGTLFVPEKLQGKGTMPLLLHFHGGTWLPEVAAAEISTAVITIQIGSGSGVYAKAFADPQQFSRLLSEAEEKSQSKFTTITLSAWSAGYGAVREILKAEENYQRVDRVLLIDGLHTGYLNGKPGPQESELEIAPLEIFLKFACDAVAGRKQMMITHSEIFPGTFASTTETADYVLRELKLVRRPVLRWGPMGTQQLSEVRAGKFLLLGYAGNSAPDHVDQLHALPKLLRMLK